MTEIELKTLLESIKVSENPDVYMKVAYDHFRTKTTPPFILFRNDDSSSFNADDKTYILKHNYIIDLGTLVKEPTLEEKVETLLNDNNLPFDKEEDFLESEQIYQIRYLI